MLTIVKTITGKHRYCQISNNDNDEGETHFLCEGMIWNLLVGSLRMEFAMTSFYILHILMGVIAVAWCHTNSGRTCRSASP
jgi:hypothetical protein